MQQWVRMTFGVNGRFNKDLATHVIVLGSVAFLSAALLPAGAAIFCLGALAGTAGALMSWSQFFNEFGYIKRSYSVDDDQTDGQIAPGDRTRHFGEFL